MAAQQVLGHRRHERAREQIRREHGKHDRLGQRNEQIAGYAAEQKHGHEHDANGEGRDKCRNGNLLGAVEDGVLDLLTHGEIAVDVLNFNRGVIDQNADRERQSPQGHNVDGFP